MFSTIFLILLTLQILNGSSNLAPVWDLRYEMLRKPMGGTKESARFDGDERLDSTHFLAWSGTELMGCSSLMRADNVSLQSWFRPGTSVYQLRGMAVAEGKQGQGIGKELLLAIHAWADTPTTRPAWQEDRTLSDLWCNAREPAIGFYGKNGWKPIGDLFDIPNVGPHIVMWRDQREHPQMSGEAP